MAVDRRTFRSRVARRMFAVFVACSLVPVLAFAAYSYSRVRDQLEADAAIALGRDSKSAAMSIFERLTIASTALRSAARSSGETRYPGEGRSEAFRRLTRRAGSELMLGPDASRRLAQPGAVLFRFRAPDPTLLLELYLQTDDGVLVGELDPDFIFVPERRRVGERYWVEDEAGRPLFATAEDQQSEAVLSESPDRPTRTTFELSGPQGQELGVVWPLFLRTPFDAPSLRVGLSRSKTEIHRPLLEFERSFPIIALLALVTAVGLALREIRRTLVPLDALTEAAKTLAGRAFATRVEIETNDEFHALGEAFNRMAADIGEHVTSLEQLHAIGVALSSEESLELVLEKIVQGAATLLGGSACALFLNPADSASSQDPRIERAWVDGGSNYPALLASFPRAEAFLAVETAEPVRADRAGTDEPDNDDEWGRFREATGISIHALLATPFRLQRGDVHGALVVIRESGSASGFNDTELHLAQSLASQAALSIQQARLVANLRGLFEGLIQLTVRAIDEKSLHTGDHCRKVPILSDLITDAACRATEGAFKDFDLSPDERYELRIAALLHDCGKIVTPVQVLDKATKLEAIIDQIELVRLRAELLEREQQLAEPAGTSQYSAETPSLRDDMRLIEQCNLGSESMPEEHKRQLREIQKRRVWTDPRGRRRSLLTDRDVHNLSVTTGTLNAEEREIINSHVVTTMRMLEELPFPKELRNVPGIAGAHHEKVNGRGYPLGLGGEELSMRCRILGFADVFEALTAADRPYRRGTTLSESLRILERMVAEGHLDANLHELFIGERLFLRYAVDHIDPTQIDDEYRSILEEATAPWDFSEG